MTASMVPWQHIESNISSLHEAMYSREWLRQLQPCGLRVAIKRLSSLGSPYLNSVCRQHDNLIGCGQCYSTPKIGILEIVIFGCCYLCFFKTRSYSRWSNSTTQPRRRHFVSAHNMTVKSNELKQSVKAERWKHGKQPDNSEQDQLVNHEVASP